MSERTPGAYADLIERLEKCEGQDRDLDARIVYAIKPALHRMGSLEEWLATDASKAGRTYTYSIDDALTLVPEGFKWKLGYSRHVPCVADVMDYRADAAIGRFDGECDSNHAIALCIAALKARAALLPVERDRS